MIKTKQAILMSIIGLIIMITNVQVYAGRKGEIQNPDRENIQYDQDKYADVIFTARHNTNLKDHILYITVLNIDTDEQYGFKFTKYNNYVVKDTLPLGNYQVVDGGVPNDWTGEFSPQNINFKINNRSTAKKITIDFGNDSKLKSDKIYQTQQKKLKSYHGLKQHKDNSSLLLGIIFISILFICIFFTKLYRKFR